MFVKDFLSSAKEISGADEAAGTPDTVSLRNYTEAETRHIEMAQDVLFHL